MAFKDYNKLRVAWPAPSPGVMLYVGGSTRSFRCDAQIHRERCGGNVFTRLDGESARYRCNSCGDVYVGERAALEARS